MESLEASTDSAPTPRRSRRHEDGIRIVVEHKQLIVRRIAIRDFVISPAVPCNRM